MVVYSTTSQHRNIPIYLGYICSTCLNPVILFLNVRIAMFKGETFSGGDLSYAFSQGYNEGVNRLSTYLKECCDGSLNLGFLKVDCPFKMDNGVFVGIGAPAIDCGCPICGSVMDWQTSKKYTRQSTNAFNPRLFTNKQKAILWLHDQYKILKNNADSIISTWDDESTHLDEKLVKETNDLCIKLSREKEEKESSLQEKKNEYKKSLFKNRKLIKSEIETLETELSSLQEQCDDAKIKSKIAKYNYRADRIYSIGYNPEPISLVCSVPDKNGKLIGYSICLTLSLKDETESFYGEDAKSFIDFKEWYQLDVPLKKITASKTFEKQRGLLKSCCCHKCGNKLDADERFCNKCGAPQDNNIDSSELPMNKSICSNCGEILDIDEKFCHKCGNPSNKRDIKQEIQAHINKSQAKLRRAYIFIGDGEWEEADKYLEMVLDEEPENAYAYLGKVLVELKITDIKEIHKDIELIKLTKSYKHLMEFGDDLLHDFIEVGK